MEESDSPRGLRSKIHSLVDNPCPESTEESLQAFMEVHQDILSTADEFEPLSQAGAAVTDAFASNPARLYGELLRLCVLVVEAGNSEARLAQVASEARERAVRQRIECPEAQVDGAFQKLFSDQLEGDYVCEKRGEEGIAIEDNFVIGSLVTPVKTSGVQIGVGGISLDASPAGQRQRGVAATRHCQYSGGGSQYSGGSGSQGQGPRRGNQGGKSSLFSSFLGSIGGGASSRGEVRRRPLVPDNDLVQRIVAMGFPPSESSQALLDCGNDCMRALEMLTAVDAGLAGQMEALGFERSRVRKALFKSNNDAAATLELLTSSTEFQGQEEDDDFEIIDSADAAI